MLSLFESISLFRRTKSKDTFLDHRRLESCLDLIRMAKFSTPYTQAVFVAQLLILVTPVKAKNSRYDANAMNVFYALLVACECHERSLYDLYIDEGDLIALAKWIFAKGRFHPSHGNELIRILNTAENKRDAEATS